MDTTVTFHGQFLNIHKLVMNGTQFRLSYAVLLLTGSTAIILATVKFDDW